MSIVIYQLRCDNCGATVLTPGAVIPSTWGAVNTPQKSLDICDKCVTLPLNQLIAKGAPVV